MKLNLKKTVVKNLSKDGKKLPVELTPQVAGGRVAGTHYEFCDPTYTDHCQTETVLEK